MHASSPPAVSRRRSPLWRGIVYGVLSVVVAHALLGTAAVQRRVWAAVADRAGAADWFMRDLVQVRSVHLARAELADTRELLLVGSSQVAAGFDLELIRTQWQETPVRMMSVGAMTAQRMSFMDPYLAVGTNDLVVLYLSVRDVIPGRPLQMNWMRPFATWRGLWALHEIGASRYFFEDWGRLSDLALAASSEWWRSRDYMRHLLVNVGGLNETRHPSAAQAQMWAELTEPGGGDEPLGDAERSALEAMQFAALERILRNWRERGAQLMVLEGQLRPDIDLPDHDRLQERLNSALQAWSTEIGFDYWPRTEQAWEHPLEEWKDPTHLNETGREKLTGHLLSRLQKPPGA